jgi:glycopeptide antibiotics resistance protein
MKQRFLVATLVVYLLVVAALTIMPTHFSRGNLAHADHINVVPLGYSFQCFRQDRNAHPHLTAFCLRNTLGNIALFLPLGILLPLIFTRLRSWQRMIAIAFLLSLSIETIQFMLRFIGSPRAVDIDDVILNTCGAWLGWVIAKRAAGRGTHVSSL